MIDYELKDVDYSNVISYIDSKLEEDSVHNPSMDMDAYSYDALYKRLLGAAVAVPSLNNLLTLMVVSIIMMACQVTTSDQKEFVLAVTMLNAFLEEDTSKTYTNEEVNQLLMKQYNYLVYNCTLSKVGITVHTLDTLLNKN